MPKLGIMIEGQEGLTWERWRRLCADVEALGFASLRRSDHLISVMGQSERDDIETWTSLALAAEWTRRIEFGPMVSPMTFRPPALLAKIAATVDALSGGRLLLGVGAGWNENEHNVFELPFLTQRGRFDLLESGIGTMRRIWETTNPKPKRHPIPLLIGGKGMRRTLPLVAREASEWNLSQLNADSFRQGRDRLAEICREIGRDPSEIRHSIMTSFIVGRDRAELLERAAKMRDVVRPLASMSPEEVLETRKEAWFVGTPEEIAERMREFGRLGVHLFMLQHFLLDDREALELLAAEVMPAVA